MPLIDLWSSKIRNALKEGGFSNGTSFFLMAARLLSLLLGTVTTFLIARGLGPAGFGQYSVALALTGVAGILNTLGLHTSASRYVAQHLHTPRLRQVIHRAYGVKLGLSALVFVGFGVFLQIHPTPYALLALVFTLFNNVKDFQVQLLSSGLQMRTVAALSLAISTLRLLCVAGWMAQPSPHAPSLQALFWVNLGAMAVAMGLSGWGVAYWLRREAPSEPRPPQEEAGFGTWALLGYALPLCLIGLADYLFFESGTLFVERFLNVQSAGIFAAVMVAANKAPILSVIIANVYAPFIGRLFHQSGPPSPLIPQATYHAIKMNLLIVVPGAWCCLLLARELIVALFGPSFLAAVPLLQVLSLYVFLHCFFAPLAIIIGYLGLATRRVLFLLPLSLLFVGLNVLLIPRWGVTGAGVAVTAVHVVETLWFIRLIQQTCGVTGSRIYRLLGGLGGVGLVAYGPAALLATACFQGALPRLGLTALVGTLVYLVLLWRFRLVTPDFLNQRWDLAQVTEDPVK